ncbi:MAG: hypothetical protein MJZ52_03845 [Bacteroidales bacterium]|nr:hypothetical protein [Bacteroidales bacterium]
MKQYLLMVIAALTALIAAMLSVNIATHGLTHEYENRSLPKRHIVPETFHAIGESPEQEPEHTGMPTTSAEGTELDEAAALPLPLMSMEMMSEMEPSQLPPLDAGMVNVTGGRNNVDSHTAGYHVDTHPDEFVINVPYDPSLLPQGFTEDDIQTYVYDKQYHRWVAIQRDSVNMEELLVCSRYRPWEKGLPHTQNDLSNPQDALAQVQDMMSFAPQGDGGGDSPLDFVNAVLKTPEMPETSAYTPTSIKELKAADPLEGLTLMQPPTANNSGTANMSYPIEIPAGRQGMQPNLALTYSSGGGNGWLGVGWDISIPSITVETRWGVPRYDSQMESEVYVYGGEQLVTYDSTVGDYRKLPHRTNQWTSRYDLDHDGYEQFYPRKNEAFDSIVRHGNGPSNYWWSVTHKNGVTDYYGGYASDSSMNNNCVLRTGDNNTSGAIAHWALAESVDPFGNSVRYYYDIEYNAGISGSNIEGKQIYLNNIRYTNHPDAPSHYSVSFVRKTGRNDVIIAANRGFKEVTADILCYVEIKFDSTVIRRYLFCTENERESQYKTRLTDVVRIDDIWDFTGCDMTWGDINKWNFSGTRTHFDYFDAPSGNSIFASPQSNNLDNDDIKAIFITQPFNNSEGKSTALGSTKGKNWSLGGTASVGVGFNVCMTTVSVGGNFDYSRSASEGMLTLIDLDGDGLADKVFKDGNKVCYRKRLQTANESIAYGPKQEIAGVSDFLKESSSSTTWGLQASAIVSFSAGWPTTTSTTTTYFADVNADGLPDLITEGGVLFNTTQPGGSVTFKPYSQILGEQTNFDDNEPITVNSALPCEQFIFDGAVNDSIACGEYWKFDSYYEIKSCHPEQYEPLRVLFDSLLNTGEYVVSYAYEEMDSASYQPECYHPVKFWLYTKAIRCNSLPLDPDVDAVKVWVAPKAGQIEISSEFRLLEDSSESRIQSRLVDGVRYTIQHNSAPYVVNDTLHSTSAVELISEAIAKSDYDPHPYMDTISVKEGDLLFFRLQSQGNRSFDVADWQRNIRYLGANPGTDQYGLDTNRYSSSGDFTVSGQHYFQAHMTGSSAQIQIHIKAADTLGNDASLEVWLPSSYTPNPEVYPIYPGQDDVFEITIPYLYENDVVRFLANSTGGTNWGAVEIRPHIEYAYWDSSSGNTIYDTLDYYPPVNIDFNNYKRTEIDSLEHKLFGPLYRGWGQFAYNNNDTNSVITDSIDISALIIDPILLSNNPSDSANIYSSPNVDSNSTQEEATADYDAQHMYNPLSNSTRWIEMQAESRYWAWVGYGNINYMMRDTVTNTRLPGLASAPETSDIPEYDHPVPQPTETGNRALILPKTVRKQNVSKLRNLSLNLTVPVVPISTGSSNSNGENVILTDYMDLNGDRYPDFVGEVNVQYSMPWGGIGTLQSLSPHVTGVSGSGTHSGGTTFGASYSMPTRGTSNNPKTSKISFDGQGSLSATIGNGSDNTDYTFMDVNGDGLPDKVTNSGGVALNIGYSFLPYENWNSDYIRKGKSTNEGLSIGLGSVNIAQASISGGVGLNSSENRTEDMLMDFNGDGLPDMVSKVGSALKVSYNYGNGQWSPWETVSGLSDMSYGTSYSESVNAGVTLGFTFCGFFKVNVGVQVAPYNRTFSKDRVQLTDINGDGYIDYVTSDSEGNMTVRYNQTGKTNLLRRVANFTGSTIDMDYAMSQSSFEKPQRAWTLSSVMVADSSSPLTGNVSHTEFTYEYPHYDRNERMDYGYRKVTTKQYDTDGGDTLYRYTVEEYENRIFNKRGRKTRDCVYDAAGKPYVEHLYDATLLDFAGTSVSDDSCARADVYVANEATLTNYYEGQNAPRITSRVGYIYDNKRNITQYTHFGDTTRHDEYFKAEISYASGMPHNLVALPIQIEVTDQTGNLLRKRTAIYTSTGKLEQLTHHNNTYNAEYRFKYDQYGNLAYVLLPENQNGQGLEYEYQYDTIVHTYPVRVDNLSLGFHSSASYDFRFGKPTKTIDVNGNEIWYAYDFLGRTSTITAPYEQDNNVPYTIKMQYFPKNYSKINIFGTNTSQSYAITHHYDPQHPTDDIATTIMTDGWGRLLQTKKDAAINGLERSIVSGKVVYDCFGRTVEQYHPFTEDTALRSSYNAFYDSSTKTLTQYDILDRQTRVELPTNEVTAMNYGFDNFGGKTYFSTITTDALNNSLQVLKGTLGQQVKQVAPHNTTTLFEYDCLGQLKKSTDPDGFETFYEYDMFGQMIHRKHPDAGNDKYEYDPAGNLIRHLNEMGEVLNYRYHYNQLTDIFCSHYPGNNVHYEYGTAADTNTNAVGKVVYQEDASGWQKFSYGKLGEVTKNIRTFVAPCDDFSYTFVMEYEYDSWNRIQRMTYPDGEVVSYRYDKGGMLKSVKGVKNGVTYKYIDSILYNEFEQKDEVYYGNGTRTSYKYDILRRLVWLYSQTSAGEPMQSIDYSYDAVSNIVSIDNTVGMLSNGLGGKYQNIYTYDDLYRLEQAKGNWYGNNPLGYNLEMRYMPNGRIAQKNLDADTYTQTPFSSNQSTVHYRNNYHYDNPIQPNTLTHIANGTIQDFNWDVKGNLVFHHRDEEPLNRSFCWDEENRLQGVKDKQYLSFYQYDANGERTYKLTGGISRQNISGRWSAFYLLDNPTLYPSPYIVVTRKGYTKHYYAENERIASRIGGGGIKEIDTPIVEWEVVRKKALDLNCTHLKKVLECLRRPDVSIKNTLKDIYKYKNIVNQEKDCYWYHPDHLGSSSWITFSDGKAVQHLHYLPWGENFVDQRSTGWNARFTFSAKERDVETGLSYFGSRYYSSDLSIWLSVDPMASKYPGLSPYIYCANNPVKLVDPNGEEIGPITRIRAAYSFLGTPYKQESNSAPDYLRTANTKAATSFMDCSELVCRVMAMDNITEKVEHYTSRTLVNEILNDKNKYEKSEIPQAGDIVAWPGHTGIIESFDEDTQLVTVLHATSYQTGNKEVKSVVRETYSKSYYDKKGAGFYHPIDENPDYILPEITVTAPAPITD